MSKRGRTKALTRSIPPELDRRLAREARRQSLVVSGRASEIDALEFIEGAADDQGWR